MMVSYGSITCEVENFIATVTIDRPPVNALNDKLMDELSACFVDLSERDDVRCVIITGAGRSFVAGADISEFVGISGKAFQRLSLKGHQIFNQIESFHAPAIAAINGFALGAGLELALSCDIRIASEKAKLGLPEASLGIIPGYGGTARLAKMINIGQAKYMLYTAEHIDAHRAYEIGLVQEVVAPEELMSRVRAIAEKIIVNAPIAILEAKNVINTARGASMAETLSLENEAERRAASSADKEEGVAAFLEKRSPQFHNR